MSLASHQLDAFLEVARNRSFSRAAKKLFVTQSALSQRVQALEETLGVTLFVRDREGARLTDRGHELLRYCQKKESLEAEFLEAMKQPETGEFSGVLRLGAFSSLLRPVLMPALNPLIEENPSLQVDFIQSEMRELPGLLYRGEADYIVTDHEIKRHGVHSELLGEEENVLIECRHSRARNHFFLDHDFEDNTTQLFWARQKGKPPEYQRCFMDDVFGILDGVAMGMGRAVMSKHLAVDHPDIVIKKNYRSYNSPVLLHYYEQPFYSKLHEAVVDLLMKNCRSRL